MVVKQYINNLSLNQVYWLLKTILKCNNLLDHFDKKTFMKRNLWIRYATILIIWNIYFAI